MLAQFCGDYDEATPQYRGALAIFERLGDQAGMAIIYSRMGVPARACGGPADQSIACTCGPW